MNQVTICLIIFLITIIGYCSGKFSLATIAQTAVVALTLTGCLTAEKALSYYSNSTVIMIGGMCIVAAGFNRTNFCKNMANTIASYAKGSLTKIVFGYALIGVILSQLIQSPAVCFTILAPMLIASVEPLGVKPSKVMFPVAVAIISTCCVLPVGAGATVPAELNGYIEAYGYTAHMVGFLDPMKARLPLLIISLIYFGIFAVRFAPDEPIVATTITEKKGKEKAPLSNFSEHAAIFLFFATAVALMFSDQLGLEEWTVCVIGALLMIFCGVLKPREASGALPLSMLLLIVGSQAMAGALNATGAGDLIGGYVANLVSALGGNSYLIGLIFFIVPFVQTQFMSNRATMLIYHPIAIATCAAIGGNPVGLMILIQSACLTAFMTPMSTSAAPYMFEYGGYTQLSIVKQGWPYCIVACIISVGWIMTIFPVL